MSVGTNAVTLTATNSRLARVKDNMAAFRETTAFHKTTASGVSKGQQARPCGALGCERASFLPPGAALQPRRTRTPKDCESARLLQAAAKAGDSGDDDDMSEEEVPSFAALMAALPVSRPKQRAPERAGAAPTRGEA